MRIPYTEYAVAAGQYVAMTLVGLTLLAAPAALAADTIYSENFDPYPDNTTDPGNGKWSLITSSSVNGSNSGDYFKVKTRSGDEVLEARDTNVENQIFRTQNIDISGYANLRFWVRVSESGSFENEDYVKVYFQTDSDPQVLSYTVINDFGVFTHENTTFSGTNIQIEIHVKNSSSSEYYRIEEVVVEGDPVPQISITTPDQSVEYETNLITISGTSANAVGNIAWTNVLTGGNATIAAGASWTINNIPLAVGANPIIVTTTNSYGSTNGTVTITRAEGEPPTITTTAASVVGTNAATLNGNLSVAGNPAADVYVFYGTSDGVSTKASWETSVLVDDDAIAGAKSHAASALSPNTTYHYRYFASNSVAETWGSTASFTTLEPPTITTTAASDVTTNAATLNGNLSVAGNPAANVYVFYGTNDGVNTKSSWDTSVLVETGASAGAKGHTASALSPNTTYHYRYYASNSVAETWGSTASFVTLFILPVSADWYSPNWMYRKQIDVDGEFVARAALAPATNVVLAANGGVLDSFTSEYGSGWVASDLNNGVTNEDGWSSSHNPSSPQEFVYSFSGGQSATLSQAVIHGGTAEGQYFSKDIEIWTSADGFNYTQVASGTLANSANDSITLDLGGVVASNVKLVITSGHRTDYWELAELEVMGVYATGGSADIELESTTLSYETGGDNDFDVSMPATRPDGDLYVAQIAMEGGASINSIPSGWTEITDRDNGGSTRFATYWKIGSSEPSTYRWSASSSKKWIGAIHRISGADASSPIHASGDATGDSSSPTAPSVTTTVEDCLILRMYGAEGDEQASPYAPSGTTAIFQDDSGGNPVSAAAYEELASAGSTGSGAFSMSGGKKWVAATIAIAPGVAPGGGGGITLTNFPILVSLTADPDLVAHAQADGDDFVFTSADGVTVLPYEIEDYDPSTGELTAWVNVPSVSSVSNVTLYCYYGNALANSQQDATNLWGGIYSFVHHFAQTSGSYLDSTGNGLDAIPLNGVLRGIPGMHAWGAGFDGDDDHALIADDDALDGVVDFSLETWINADGGGSSEGALAASVTDSFEFAPTDGEEPAFVQISNNIYAVAFTGGGSDGWISTFEVNGDGQIGASLLDSFEFDNKQGMNADILHVFDGIYAIAYKGDKNDGFLVTVQIESDGQIGASVLDKYEFDTKDGKYPDICVVSGGVLAIAYQGKSSDGQLVTLEVAANGDISSKIDSLEFDPSDGREPCAIVVSPGIFAIAYRGSGDDGKVKTYQISTGGAIGNSAIDTLTFDSGKCKKPCLAHVVGDTYIVAYEDDQDDEGGLVTFSISTNGLIGDAVLASDSFDTVLIRTPVITRIGSGLLALAYAGSGSDGFIQTLRVDANGQFLNTQIDILEFDTTLGYYPAIALLDDGVLGIFYTGTSQWSGMIKTLTYDVIDASLGNEFWNLTMSDSEVLVRIGDSLLGTSVTSAWTHVVMTFTAAASNQALYVDGALLAQAPLPLASIPDLNSGFDMGAGFAGTLDETRFFREALGDEWILANYTIQSDADAYLTVGPEEVSQLLTPVVDNDAGAVEVTPSQAVLTGRVIQGLPTPYVWMFYGEVDGGTDTTSWAQQVFLGVQDTAFSNTVTGLALDTLYYYTTLASNLVGEAWAPASTNFTTLPEIDSDGDNMPDWWEDMYALDKLDPANGALDPDSDGVVNLHEYLANTDPGDTNSRMQIVASMPMGSDDIRLNLNMGADRSYQILAKDNIADPFLSRGTVSSSTAGTYTWDDLGAASSTDQRFYSIRVTHAGLAYTNNEIWAMFADERVADTKYLASVPLDFGTNNTLNSLLGAQLAWGLHAGAGAGDADMIQVLTPDFEWKEFHLLTNATGGSIWWDMDTGAEADFHIETGIGFWVVRKSAPAQTGSCGILVGPSYRTSPDISITTNNNGWNVIGAHSHRALHHLNTESNLQYSTPSNQLGFAAGGSGGSTSDLRRPTERGDQIWVWENNEWLGYYWLMDHLGPKWDGRWWDNRQNDFADFSIEPGKGYYYLHRSNQWGGSNFFWRIPEP